MVALWNTIKPAILQEDPLAKANTAFGSLPGCVDGFTALGECSSTLGPVYLLQPLGKPSRLTSQTCITPSLLNDVCRLLNYAKDKKDVMSHHHPDTKAIRYQPF